MSMNFAKMSITPSKMQKWKPCLLKITSCNRISSITYLTKFVIGIALLNIVKFYHFSQLYYTVVIKYRICNIPINNFILWLIHRSIGGNWLYIWYHLISVINAIPKSWTIILGVILRVIHAVR
jgi:hypothetical protein